MKNETKFLKKAQLKDYVLIFLGIILTAASIVYIFTPNRLAAGGAQGIALVVNHLTGINSGLLMILINGMLFITAFMILGTSFGAKTLFSSLGLSFVVFIMEKYLYYGPLTDNPMLATIFGSALMGMGVGIILNRNASIGGTSLIGKIISKFTYLDQVNCIVATDILVTLFSMVVFGIEIGLYQLLSVYLTGEIINKVIDGITYRREVMIISGKRELIMKYLINDMKKGATLLNGRGGFTGKDTEIILTILTRRDFIKLKLFIRKVDPQAFISVNIVAEVSSAATESPLVKINHS
ncbi:YitT family protein [Proteiniclasticum sp. SCR006]|uniref:YitT family protein n=1 Tax=Proteiniclasticum aestuarii TaxID=2817862 RepID=A0A939KHZ2_9CLOT|nr:YitT family protein [Proteiniclasticum aestuarii]MBO1263608.1 YitT family protein [Proteiniclasticum aestuarii]